MTEYHVSDATGDDTDTGLTEALAFKTINKAASVVAAGDKVHIKDDGTYKEVITLITLGTPTAAIEFEGYKTTKGDNGQITIDGESTRATSFSRAAGGDLYHVFRNIRVTGHTDHGMDLGSSDRAIFEFLRVDNSGDMGIQMDDYGAFICCQFDNNVGRAVGLGTYGIYMGCVAFGNAQGLIGENVSIIGCLSYGNTTKQLESAFSFGTQLVAFCTVDGKNLAGTTGINLGTGLTNIRGVMNNIVVGCAIGIDGGSTDGTPHYVSWNNLLFDNTANYNNWSTPRNELLVDPKFVDRSGDDYDLQGDSPARGAAIDSGELVGVASLSDLGALQTGRSMIAHGMTGGML